MRYIWIFALPAVVFGQSIMVFDSERVFDSLGEVADARELLESEIDEWNLHVDSLQEEIDALEEDLSRTIMMSPDRRLEKESLLEEKKTQLEDYLASVFGPGGLMERRNEELVAPIITTINEAVKDIASEEGMKIVLDASAGQVVYADASVDITDRVIERVQNAGD